MTDLCDTFVQDTSGPKLSMEEVRDSMKGTKRLDRVEPNMVLNEELINVPFTRGDRHPGPTGPRIRSQLQEVRTGAGAYHGTPGICVELRRHERLPPPGQDRQDY